MSPAPQPEKDAAGRAVGKPAGTVVVIVGPAQRAALARWVAQMIRRTLEREVADERA